MLTQSENCKRLTIVARLLMGSSLTTLGLTLAVPSLAQTALPAVQV